MKVIDYLILLSQGVNISVRCPNGCFNNVTTLINNLTKYVYVEHIANEDIDKVTRLEKYFKLNVDNMLKDTPIEDKKIEKLEIGTIVDDELQGLIKSINLCNKELENKINEIIDKLNGDNNE